MRFTSLFLCLAAGTTVTSSTVVPPSLYYLFGGVHFSDVNKHHYGAPTPPWGKGAWPGWYWGDHYEDHPDLFCLSPFVCKALAAFHLPFRCPTGPPPPVPCERYKQTFHNLTGATQASDYLTFGLVQNVSACLAMCDSVQGCGFVNTYHDVNGKNGSPLLTCALFKNCHNASDADNTGGQSQPDGSIDYITDSDGWCKVA